MTDHPAHPDSLHLDERQRAMLQAMGVTHWWPAEAPATQATAENTVANNAMDKSAGGTFGLNYSPATSTAHVAHAAPAAKAPTATRVVTSIPTPTNPLRPVAQPTTTADTGPVADMDWDTLTDSIAQCQSCGLCKGRHLAVPGAGPRQARWMVVGDAPDEDEDQQGQPFAGATGQLLDAMLAAMGLTRERDVYLANAIKCRPPHDRNPEPAEVAQCLPYLRRQITLVQPDIILAMGKFAAQVLLQGVVPDAEKAHLGKLRGPVYMVAGTPVVVTYHPASLLRNPADKAKVWDDLCLAMAHVAHNPW